MILVVGGAGYIGSHMVRCLQEAGEPHLVFDNLEAGHREAIGASKLFVGDLRHPDDLARVFAEHSIDVVVHMAAYISVGESVREPGKYYRNNTLGTLHLLEAMRQAGVGQIVFSSTAAVYGEPEFLPITEDHPQRPTSPYGHSKLAVEWMLEDYGVAHGMRAVALRYFNASGAHPRGDIGEDHAPEEHLIPLAILAALGRRPALKVFGTDYPTEDGTCVRDYIHVCDLADAHLLAIRHLRNGGEARAYNLGNGRGFSIRQVLATVGQAIGSAVPSENAPRRPGDPAVLVASSDAFESDFGWRPQRPELQTIVEDAVRWHQDHPEGYRG